MLVRSSGSRTSPFESSFFFNPNECCRNSIGVGRIARERRAHRPSNAGLCAICQTVTSRVASVVAWGSARREQERGYLEDLIARRFWS